jgi:hypothetical protein
MIHPTNILAEPSQLRFQFESHQDDEQDQDRKSILVSGEESESFLRCYHKEEKTLFVAPDARDEMRFHLERTRKQMTQSLQTQ